jgi:sulfoxide reductase heme-binding subunit YedZ
LIGPWNVLLRRRNPVSSDLRRDVGIWAGVFCLLHSVIGQCVHLRGRPWLYYVYDGKRELRHSVPLRHDLFGFSNDTGLLSALVVIVLLATSNDYALRKLGTPEWKQLQRWNYAAFALGAAHTIGYQWSQKQNLPFHVIAWICIALTAGMQTVGWWKRRSGETRSVVTEDGKALSTAR